MMTGVWHVEEAPTADVVVSSGHPRPGSRTSRLAAELGERIARSRGNGTFVTVDVAELGAGLLAPADEATGRAMLPSDR